MAAREDQREPFVRHGLVDRLRQLLEQRDLLL